MKILSIALTFVLLLALSVSALPVTGGIVVSPATPTLNDLVTIRVANSFGAEASLGSASIIRSGNTFVIDQNVQIACSLPSDPVVASEFVVGPLPAGVYSVIADISFTSVDPAPGCNPGPISQTTAFAVGTGAGVPTLSFPMIIVLAFSLAVIATVALRVVR